MAITSLDPSAAHAIRARQTLVPALAHILAHRATAVPSRDACFNWRVVATTPCHSPWRTDSRSVRSVRIWCVARNDPLGKCCQAWRQHGIWRRKRRMV